MRYFVLCILFCGFMFAEQATNSTIMVRCDDGSEYDFLSAPQDIKLGSMKGAINPNVDTVVFIHGFNNSYSGATSSYSNARNVMSKELGNVNYVGIYWPSNTLDFPTAIKRANKSGKYIMHIVSEINKQTGGKSRIHLVCHSLGARVVLNTLAENTARSIPWGNMCFLAAAVDKDAFFTFNGTNIVGRNNFIVYSENDLVLKYLYSRDQIAQLPGAEKFNALSYDEKVQYLENLPKRQLRSAFDRSLYTKLQGTRGVAMGLVGAFLGNSNELQNVENLDKSSIVPSHSYWSNSKILSYTAKKIKE
ncbi:DUF726 domain-containing protein [Candidatus Uabimicrobium amorphum]|uniref:DUF676 domain-containing protein n=1 Tax=Uabimicrobium amorphum TaxID=2596890 RepID=A0A5S9F678_UABAM|nr:DUF726 domain-containing protein [Candidatus Uabimicrobium amorphum]BBM87605.1 hypothetical protein UABAM_06017 [Candidatus Uabimicrobium amorphum]